MNQKDYKAIAEIMKPYVNTPIIKHSVIGICYKLADYFEREYTKEGDIIRRNPFNRIQFLKDCGVN